MYIYIIRSQTTRPSVRVQRASFKFVGTMHTIDFSVFSRDYSASGVIVYELPTLFAALIVTGACKFTLGFRGSSSCWIGEEKKIELRASGEKL